MNPAPTNNFTKAVPMGAEATSEEVPVEEEEPNPPSEPRVEIDPTLFVLSEQEKEWALSIKDAIEGLPDLDNLSDFMYAHMGIVAKGDHDWAVDRAYKMQEVRQEYKIALTYNEGVRQMHYFRDHYTNWMMSYTCNPKTGKVVQVMDWTNPEVAKVWQNPKHYEMMIKAATYMCYANYPSLECVRVGNVHVFECEGHPWASLGMEDFKYFNRVTALTQGTFPTVLKTKFYNTPVMVDIALSMAKRMIPKEVHSNFEVGCQFPAGRLDQFYMVPTPEIASQRAIDNMCAALKLKVGK